MGLKLHYVKALTKVGEWVIWEKIGYLQYFSKIIRIYSFWVGE